MSNKVSICCKTDCNIRFTCAQFARAMDVNAGKILGNYYIIDKCSYEKS